MSTRRIIFLVIGISVFVVLLLVVACGGVLFGVFKLLDATTAHRCGLAYVQRSPAAIDMLGSPIVQHGFTGGSTNETNGSTQENLTFTVAGPKGEAKVEARGTYSSFENHLVVRLGRNGESTPIYDGKGDCPELHKQ